MPQTLALFSGSSPRAPAPAKPWTFGRAAAVVRHAESAGTQKKEYDYLAGLRRRMADVQAADAREAELYKAGRGELPVLCLDALLPRQRLQFETGDATFSAFLRGVGLGGIFAMVGLDFKTRRLRRRGVVARLEFVDSSNASDEGAPTSVSVSVVGRRRMEVLGGRSDLCLRAGCFRQGYGDDLSGGVGLGWGDETFTDVPERAGPAAAAKTTVPVSEEVQQMQPPSKWSNVEVAVLRDADEEVLFKDSELGAVLARAAGDAAGSAAAEESLSPLEQEELEQPCKALRELVAKWQKLVRDPETFENVYVTAGVRVRPGEPQLRVDTNKLLDGVIEDLGPQPPVTSASALALWAAALINPLPALGVSPEIRGRILEASTPMERVAIAAWGVQRSILNLEGRMPLI
mmetsp:Transcript_53322/g.127196  ORF Transcript_53322/g.127196 Transcript_53322/m.127196 type:complete len:404 (+) Transcript_53322:90-1301(+)